jgi:hypothetical protein
MYGELWSEIMRIINEANAWDAKLVPNGFPLHHIVRMGKRDLHLDLAEDKCSVLAQYSDVGESGLSMVVGHDGTVNFTQEGIVLDYATAAQKIMEPFLFGGKSPFANRASSARY